MRIAALAVIMTLSVAGVRAEDARPYPVADCGKFTTQMDLNKCAADNLKSADKALNGAYQALMAKQDDAASKRRLKARAARLDRFPRSRMRVRSRPARDRRDDLADGVQRLPGGNHRDAYSRADPTAQLHAHRLPCALARTWPGRRTSRRRWTHSPAALTAAVVACNIRASVLIPRGEKQCNEF